MPEFIHTGKDKKEFVEKMFDDISNNYDILNRILSFGVDKYWRKQLIKSMSIIEGQHILDVATGTGDVVFAINDLYPDAVLPRPVVFKTRTESPTAVFLAPVVVDCNAL